MSIGHQLPTKIISSVRSRWLCLASVCTAPELREKSIVEFYGALCTRACAHSFGCVLPFLHSMYLRHAHYVSIFALHDAREVLAVCWWYAWRARGRVRASLHRAHDSPDPLHTLFYTHRNTCVARTTNSGVSSKPAAAATAADATAYLPPYISIVLKPSRCFGWPKWNVYCRLLRFDPHTEMQRSPSSCACLVKASVSSNSQGSSNCGVTRRLGGVSIARFEHSPRPVSARSVGQNDRRTGPRSTTSGGTLRVTRDSHASRVRVSVYFAFPCVHLCWPSSGRSRAHPSLWNDPIELGANRNRLELECSSPCLLTSFLFVVSFVFLARIKKKKKWQSRSL